MMPDATQDTQPRLFSAHVEKEMPKPPALPGRLGWRLTIGFFVEVVMVVALLAILTPLILAGWGFLLMSQDEASAQHLMNEWEQSQALQEKPEPEKENT